MKYRCDLPGANRFVEYMSERVNGFLVSKGPEYYVDKKKSEIQTWEVFEDAKKLGEFRKSQNKIEYEGRVPGLVNQTIAHKDELKPAEDRREIDSFHLILSNEPSAVEGDLEKKMVARPQWTRKDKHLDIPFP